MRRSTRDSLWLFALALATVVAFSSAIRAPFVFDDHPSIRLNPSVQQLTPLASVLQPPANTSVSGRPVVNVSLALNYALNHAFGVDDNGPDTTVSFHVVNILIHVLSGLLLFGLVRLTLAGWRDARVAAESTWIAGATALLWLLHPIQSEAVDYVIQRTELIVSVCYLATLFAAARAWDSENPRWWLAASLLACVLGMGSKEVMISAPFMVILYDRAFRVQSWRALFETGSRRAFYVLLLLTCSIVLFTVFNRARHTTVGFNLGITWYEYLYTQAWAITHYLRLIVWPNALNFDYGELAITGWRGVPGALLLGSAGVATLYAWTKSRWLWLGFLGAWFFMLLAPSSSIVPIKTEVAAERRIYLASAAVFILVMIGVYQLRARFAWKLRIEQATLGVLALLLAATTFARGRTYLSTESLYRDVMVKAPDNPRGYAGVGMLLLVRGPEHFAEAQALLERAVTLDSSYVGGWQALGLVAVMREQWPVAKIAYTHALRLQPQNPDAQRGMAQVLIGTGDLEGARALVDALPSPDRETLWTLGEGFVKRGDGREALPYLESAARNGLSPLDMALMSLALAQAKRPIDALAAARAATSVAGDSTQVLALVGRAMVLANRPVEARQFLRRRVELTPEDEEAKRALDSLDARNPGN